VRIVTNGAAFTECLVLKYEGAGLFPVTLGATLVQAGHGKPAGTLENVRPMGVVTLDAVHLAFNHRMMLGQTELRLRLQMALEAG